MSQFKVKEIPIDKITIEDRKRKEIGDLSSLCASLDRDGQINPVLLDEHYHLAAGERRIRAAQELGWTKVLARIMPGITPDAKLLIELAENLERKDFHWSEELEAKLCLYEHYLSVNGEFSYRDMAKIMRVSLGGLSTDLELAKAIREIPELTEHQTKGKARDSYKKLQSQAQAIIAMDNLSDEDKSALQQMMATSSAGVSYDTQASDAEKPALAGDHTHQEVPDEAKPLLAKHVPAESDESLPKFIYEICNFKDLLPKLPDEMIGFVEVDPPYAINFNSVYGQTQQIEAKAQDWTLEEFQDNMAILLNNIKRKLLSESWLLLWIGAEHEEWVQDLAVKLGYGIQPAGFWTKPSGGSNTPSTTMIHNYEKFLLLRHGNARFNIPSVKAAMEFNPVPNQERYHQWQKPLEMYQYFIRACGRPGSLFFSPFAGSGTSMIAAAQGGMIPVGCDTTKKYFYRFYATYKEYCYDPGKTTSQEDPDLHMLPREISAD